MERSEILNDLAAVFRWTAKLNMHEGIANHFSVCLPDSDGSFYVNGTGMHFSKIKASDLVLIEDKNLKEMKNKPEVVDSPKAADLPPIKGRLNFNNVSFSYLPDVPVLDDLSIEVSPGQTLAIVGPTGAGKSTIVSLVARFYDVKSGSVTVDGYDVRNITHESLAKQMSMVLQEPFLYSTTVAENIRFAKTSVTQSDIETATKALGAHEFIMNLPQGYETVLLERGSNLSVGERQLISFARALVADPRILILDEATANVDSHTEQLIQDALKALLEGRTAVIIAHRLSTIKEADQILVLKQGKLEELGKHDELLELNGLYAKLYEMNFRDNA